MTTAQQSAALIPLWSAAMRADGQSAATIRRRTGTLRRFARHLGRDPQSMTPDDVTTWLAHFPAPATRFAYDSDLRAFWSWLVLTGRAEVDPTARVRRPRPPKGHPRPAETEDVMRVLERARGDARAMVLLAAYEALRRHEIAKIRSDDFVQGGRLLRVVGKGGVEAYVAVHELVAEEAARRGDCGWWFPGRYGRGHVAGDTVAVKIASEFGAIGVHATPHMLRHWCATEMLLAGANLRQVQEHLRHASIGTTELYTRIMRDDLAVAVARLPLPTAA